MQSKSFKIEFSRGVDGNVIYTLPWKVDKNIVLHTDQVTPRTIPTNGLTVKGYFKLYYEQIVLAFDIKLADKGVCKRGILKGHLLPLINGRRTDNDLKTLFPSVKGLDLAQQIQYFNLAIYEKEWMYREADIDDGVSYLLSILHGNGKYIDLLKLTKFDLQQKAMAVLILSLYMESQYRVLDLYTVEILIKVCMGSPVTLKKEDNRWQSYPKSVELPENIIFV